MTPLRLLLLALLLLPLPALGAPPLRPYAGRGVLIIPATDVSGAVELYEYPAVRRKGSILLTELPTLHPALPSKRGEIALATTALREGSARVSVAASGEEGWLILRPGWRCLPWERFLVGRVVRLMTGLQGTASQVRQTPAESGGNVGSISAGSPLLLGEIRGDWALVMKGGTPLGWLRWRDGDGRMMVAVE